MHWHLCTFEHVCVQLLPGNGRQEGMGKREEHLLEVSFLCTQLCCFWGLMSYRLSSGEQSTLFKLPMEYLMVENIHCSPTSVCVGSVAIAVVALPSPCLSSCGGCSGHRLLSKSSSSTQGMQSVQCWMCLCKAKGFPCCAGSWLWECCEGLHACVYICLK